MNFFEFLDTKYRKTANALSQVYHPIPDGYAKAASSLIGFQRSLSKWCSMPLLVIEYLLVKTSWRDAPVFEIQTKPAHTLIKDGPKDSTTIVATKA